MTTASSSGAKRKLAALAGLEALNSFKVPKKSVNKLLLEPVTVDSSDFLDDILPQIRQSFRFPHLTSYLVVENAWLVHNRALEARFAEARKRIQKATSSSGTSLDSNSLSTGFLVVDSWSSVESLVANGIDPGNEPGTWLGEAKMGVVVNQCADLTVARAQYRRWAGGDTAGKSLAEDENNQHDSAAAAPPTVYLLAVRWVKSRAYVVSAEAADAEERLEPQPGYTCHVSTWSRVDPLDSGKVTLEQAYRLSQVYLYEFDEDLELCAQPGHVLPYAVIGCRWALTPEAASAEKQITATSGALLTLPSYGCKPVRSQSGKPAAAVASTASEPSALSSSSSSLASEFSPRCTALLPTPGTELCFRGRPPRHLSGPLADMPPYAMEPPRKTRRVSVLPLPPQPVLPAGELVRTARYGSRMLPSSRGSSRAGHYRSPASLTHSTTTTAAAATTTAASPSGQSSSSSTATDVSSFAPSGSNPLISQARRLQGSTDVIQRLGMPPSGCGSTESAVHSGGGGLTQGVLVGVVMLTWGPAKTEHGLSVEVITYRKSHLVPFDGLSQPCWQVERLVPWHSLHYELAGLNCFIGDRALRKKIDPSGPPVLVSVPRDQEWCLPRLTQVTATSLACEPSAFSGYRGNYFRLVLHDPTARRTEFTQLAMTLHDTSMAGVVRIPCDQSSILFVFPDCQLSRSIGLAPNDSLDTNYLHAILLTPHSLERYPFARVTCKVTRQLASIATAVTSGSNSLQQTQQASREPSRLFQSPSLPATTAAPVGDGFIFGKRKEVWGENLRIPMEAILSSLTDGGRELLGTALISLLSGQRKCDRSARAGRRTESNSTSSGTSYSTPSSSLSQSADISRLLMSAGCKLPQVDPRLDRHRLRDKQTWASVFMATVSKGLSALSKPQSPIGAATATGSEEQQRPVAAEKTSSSSPREEVCSLLSPSSPVPSPTLGAVETKRLPEPVASPPPPTSPEVVGPIMSPSQVDEEDINQAPAPKEIPLGKATVDYDDGPLLTSSPNKQQAAVVPQQPVVTPVKQLQMSSAPLNQSSKDTSLSDMEVETSFDLRNNNSPVKVPLSAGQRVALASRGLPHGALPLVSPPAALLYSPDGPSASGYFHHHPYPMTSPSVAWRYNDHWRPATRGPQDNHQRLHHFSGFRPSSAAAAVPADHQRNVPLVVGPKAGGPLSMISGFTDHVAELICSAKTLEEVSQAATSHMKDVDHRIIPVCDVERWEEQSPAASSGPPQSLFRAVGKADATAAQQLTVPELDDNEEGEIVDDDGDELETDEVEHQQHFHRRRQAGRFLRPSTRHNLSFASSDRSSSSFSGEEERYLAPAPREAHNPSCHYDPERAMLSPGRRRRSREYLEPGAFRGPTKDVSRKSVSSQPKPRSRIALEMDEEYQLVDQVIHSPSTVSEQSYSDVNTSIEDEDMRVFLSPAKNHRSHRGAFSSAHSRRRHEGPTVHVDSHGRQSKNSSSQHHHHQQHRHLCVHDVDYRLPHPLDRLLADITSSSCEAALPLQATPSMHAEPQQKSASKYSVYRPKPAEDVDKPVSRAQLEPVAAVAGPTALDSQQQPTAGHHNRLPVSVSGRPPARLARRVPLQPISTQRRRSSCGQDEQAEADEEASHVYQHHQLQFIACTNALLPTPVPPSHGVSARASRFSSSHQQHKGRKVIPTHLAAVHPNHRDASACALGQVGQTNRGSRE